MHSTTHTHTETHTHRDKQTHTHTHTHTHTQHTKSNNNINNYNTGNDQTKNTNAYSFFFFAGLLEIFFSKLILWTRASAELSSRFMLFPNCHCVCITTGCRKHTSLHADRRTE